MSANIEWNEIVKKEARGINDFDLVKCKKFKVMLWLHKKVY